MKIAIILFNLGGPDKLENVKPFLFNLFYDPAILNLPIFLRYPLAKIISNRRAPIAKKIYEELGGSSPILKLTEEQDINKKKEEVKKIIDNLSDTPKIVWLMVPSQGDVIDDLLFEQSGIVNLLQAEDILIDGGNSYFRQTYLG